jgi:uncharacterized protein (DUF697 family)/uncharacterized tellurite resistance protein B-like protein
MLTTTPKNPVLASQPTSGSSSAILAENEAMASLRVLVHVAKADGDLAPEERLSLENAFTGLQMPADVTPKSLLDEKIDFDAQLRFFTSPESRESIYQSVLGMIHVDGTCTPEEQKRLDHIRTTLQISEEKTSLARRILDEAKDTVLPSSIQPVNDPARRATEVKSDVTKYSVLSGVLGAFPVPGIAIATDLAVVAVQVKLVRDIGQRWGHKVDRKAAASLLGSLGLGTGARIAVSNLAKLVPVWGSMVGATASFASTWALGQIANKYFESGMKADMASLKSDFKAAQAEGRLAYDSNKGLIESKSKLNEATFRSLGTDLAAGRINQKDYSARVEQLA